MDTDPCAECLALIRHGRLAMDSGILDLAEARFRAAEWQARSLPSSEVKAYTLLALCHVSLVRRRRGKKKESLKLQEFAVTRLDLYSNQVEATPVQNLFAKVLIELGEYRRSLPFCERAVLSAAESKDPTAVAAGLARMGKCYERMGLRDHAVPPLRAALRAFRELPADPRLPGVLVSLGNALRKSLPVEAESLYREAAEHHVAKAHLESATVAWNNLGILCSEQGRHAEALKFYEKALQVRERTPSRSFTPIGRLLNNIANCLRRSGDFEEAHMRLDQSIEMLRLDKVDGASMLPHAYGTRGQILLEEGRNEEAVEWLQRSYAERRKAPSPDFESLVEILNDEIAALKRLGRLEEAAAAEDRLASAHVEMSQVSQVDFELGSRIGRVQGAVLVEIPYGTRLGARYVRADWNELAVRLTQEAERQKVGFSGGNVTIPKTTTMVFYGENAETLFQALQPMLVREPICIGATVTIRQGTDVRELSLSGTQM